MTPPPAPPPSEPGQPHPRPPDLRLFGTATGVWVASLVGLHASAALAGWLALGAGGVAAGIALLLRRRCWAGTPAAVGWAVAAALLGVVCGGLSTAARTSPRDAEPLAGLARSHAVGRAEVTVTDDPRALRTAGVGPATYLIPARLTRIEVADLGSIRLDVRVVVFATDEAWRTMLPSQRVASAVRLAPARGGDLAAATLTATGTPQPLDRPSWTQLAAGRLRAGLQAACGPLPPDPGGLLPGLVIGDTSRLDPALAEEFRTTGLTHLVAVSGANLAIILAVVLFVARWCRAGPWLAAAVCVMALVGFVILARPSPSVIRAAAMGGVGLLALASGRVRSAAPALATAVIVALLIDPALAVDAGFALSVVATGALVLLAPRWSAALRARGVPGGLAEALAIPAAAQVACGPIIVALSGEVSLVAVPANLLAAPAVAPATLLGVGAALVSPLWPDGARMLAWVASWPARWLVALARYGAGVPVDAVAWPSGVWGGIMLAAVTVGLLVAARRPIARRLLLVVAVGIAVGTVPLRWLASGWPPEGAVVVACDVGQGDAIVLPLAATSAIVVDAGADPVAVDGCLHRLGVRVVPILLISHFHADHVAGVTGVLRDRLVGAVIVPRFQQPVSGRDAVAEAAATAAVGIVAVEPGWTFARGPARLRVIGPLETLTGTRSDPNNNSLLVRVVSRGVSVLLLGDAETEEQQALVHDVAPSDLHADVLKVAHHGSLYQDPHLLDVVDPAVALVSVGAANPYGHPNLGLLAGLSRGGARVLRTDLDGDVAVVVRNGRIGVVQSGSRRRSQALLHTDSDAFNTLGMPWWNVRLWLHDQLRCATACHRRRGAADRTRCVRGDRGHEGRRARRRLAGVRSQRDDCRGPDGRGESVVVRRNAGRGGPGRPGCEKGSGRGPPGIRGLPGVRRRPRGDPRRWGQGQGAGRRTARGGCRDHQRRQADQAPGADRLRPGRDPAVGRQMRRRRGRGTPRGGGQ